MDPVGFDFGVKVTCLEGCVVIISSLVSHDQSSQSIPQSLVKKS